jgi:hypothetical protein
VRFEGVLAGVFGLPHGLCGFEQAVAHGLRGVFVAFGLDQHVEDLALKTGPL